MSKFKMVTCEPCNGKGRVVKQALAIRRFKDKDGNIDERVVSADMIRCSACLGKGKVRVRVEASK